MKVKRYVAANSREAFAKVKKELGSDAVILSNRPVTGGVEILALAQGDVASVVAPAQEHRPDFPVQPASQNRRAEQGRDQISGNGRSLKEFAERVQTRAPIVSGFSSVAQGRSAAATGPAAPPAATRPAPQSSDGGLIAEIKAMRGDFEKRFASFSWNEGARRRPLRAKMMRELISAGFSAPMGRRISGALPDDYNETQARAWLRSVLAKNIRCDTDADDLVRRGGVYALVGPTGVGKTTTVAKLAARCVVRFGAQKLALISTDTYRIGAQDQLAIYAKILGVQVHAAQDATGLERILRAVSSSHLVLIDTVGMGQRDTRLAEQLALLGGPRVRRMLLLNAACQLETLEDVIRVYKGNSDLSGAIITKLDEARRPGCALDAAIRHKLRLSFVTDGQRVPEDIHMPVAADLVERALAGAGDSPFALEDDEFMLLPEAGRA